LVADALARGDRCEADRLADALVSESGSARLPERYRPPLLAAVRALAARLECPAPPPPAQADEDDKDAEEDDDKGDKGSENGGNGGNGEGKGKEDKG
jgi:hypothetical protein